LNINECGDISNMVLDKIRDILESNHIDYHLVRHVATRTSEESAEARGEDLSIGGKALVLKVDNEFHLFVISAAKRINSVSIKKYFHAKKIRFATKEELLNLTELVPGSIPPFGKPIINLKLFVDKSVVKNSRIAFNAGSLTDSIVMKVEDYLNVARPEIFNFSK